LTIGAAGETRRPAREKKAHGDLFGATGENMPQSKTNKGANKTKA